MKFGLCCHFELAQAAETAGFDYIEMSVQCLLDPLADEIAFKANLQRLQTLKLPALAVNVFVPKEIKITGPDVDAKRLAEHVTTVCTRSSRAGVKTIVFGSGGARMIPEGFDRQVGHEQIVSFCRMAGAVAGDNGVTIVVEPLNRQDTNVLNTVTEAAQLVAEVDHASVKLLVDSYHCGIVSDSEQAIVDAGPLVRHVHVATVANRLLPGEEECDFIPFFRALKAASYGGNISIEAGMKDQANLHRALSILKELVKRA